MSSMKRVYFAGPLFTQAEWLWNEQLASKLVERGVDVVLPQIRAVPMLTGQEEFNPTTLFRANLEEIDKSTLVLAVLDQADADSGTCFECGYAYKVGLPIIGLRTDIRKAGDDPSGVNLMLRQCCTDFLLVPLEKRAEIDWIADRIFALIEQLD
jgi:nucleoside 2-deoxyribosyltransferase